MTESEKSTRLFGERLKALRKKMELKQSAFAKSIGTSEDTISEIERGLLSPRLDMLSKIAEQIGMTLSELVDFQDAPKADSAADKELNSLNLYLKTNSASAKEIKAVKKVTMCFLDNARSIYPVRKNRKQN